jgi:NAD(P)H-hydrate epimerase
MWIATAEHSREIDRRTTEDFGLPARVLMERAGLAVFDVVREMLPNRGKLAVLCGKGNNGGDGFVTARLARDTGFCVECLVAANSESDLRPEALEQLQIALAQGVRPVFASDARWQRKLELLGHQELIVDALLGTGAKCEVKGSIKEAIQAINRSGVPAIAVDVPSGICANTGEELGESVWALRTVTFGLPKRFLFEGIGLEHSGYWTVAEIGIPRELLNQPTNARLVESEWVGNLLPERLRASNKGDSGAVLIVAGSDRMRGAATLAANAALRAGAGLVTIAGIRAVCDAVAANLPEAMFLPLPEENGVVSPKAARLLLDSSHKINSAVFGPGLTHEPPVMEFLKEVWAEWDRPCVIDADALNAVSEGLELPQADCVLTPHPGEMSRLLHCSIAEIQSDRFRTVEQAVERFNRCVLLKGPYSIVGDPSQPMHVNSNGNPGLATGGMGDVLSGIIATLLAQDLPSYYAASCGMHWHGAAADSCAQNIGCVGYRAMDVADSLPSARARIISACERN